MRTLIDKYVNNENRGKLFCRFVDFHRGGSRIFFRRGCTRLLLYFNTNKPHRFFFFFRIPVVLENLRSSRGRGGGVGAPCTLPLDPPLFQKPFDSVWHDGLLSKLIHNKIGWRFFGLLSDVSSKFKCVIRSGDKSTNFSSFDREVRQGCILSPLLFNVCNMYNIICLRNSQRVCDYIVRFNCNSFSSYQFVKQEVRLLYSLHLRRIKRRSSKSTDRACLISCLVVM